jgi:hypothetical protein
MVTFHHVMALLVCARRRTARKLTAVNNAIRPMEIARPVPVRTVVPPLTFIQCLANE